MTRASCLFVASCGLTAAIVASSVLASQQTQRPILPEEVRQKQIQAERSARAEAERQDQSLQSVKQLYERAQETHQLCTALQQKAQSYFATLEALLDSDTGKRVARDSALVCRYDDLRGHPAVSLREINHRCDTASALVNRLQMLQSGPDVGYLPTQQTQDQVNQLYFWVNDRTSGLESNLSRLNDLLRQTPDGPTSADDMPLRIALDAIEAAFHKDLSDYRVKGEEKAAPDVEKIVVDAAYFRRIDRAWAEEQIRTREVESQVLKIKTDAETALLQAKMQMQRELTEAQTRYKDALAEIDRLRKQADVDRTGKDVDEEIKRQDQLTAIQRKQKIALAHSQEVRSLLAPFLSLGYWQPGQEQPTYDKGPVSFKRLGAEGALNKTSEGLERLVQIGEDPRDQARPRWGFDRDLRTIPPAQYEQLRKAQQYLIELGEVMVAEGMLAE